LVVLSFLGKRVGVGFQARSELALIPNMMYQPRGWKIQSRNNHKTKNKTDSEDARAGHRVRTAVRGGQEADPKGRKGNGRERGCVFG